MGLIADPQEITPGFWLLVSLVFIVPVALMLLVPRRWLWRAGLAWLLLPFIAMAAGFVLLLVVGAGDPSATPGNALLAVGYIGIFTIIPWLLVASVGLGLGLLARRIFRNDKSPKGERPAPQAPQAAAPAPAPDLAATASDEPAPDPVFDGLTTDDLHARVRVMARDHRLDESLLPVRWFPDNDAPFVHVDHRGFHIAKYDRGRPHSERVTQDLDELLYWVADEVTFHMAAQEVARGLTHADQFPSRVLAAQDRLLAERHPQWHQRWLTDTVSPAAFYRRKIQTS